MIVRVTTAAQTVTQVSMTTITAMMNV